MQLLRKRNPKKIKNMDINELTYQIRGAVFEANRILGSGFLEKVYQKALLIELWKRGLNAGLGDVGAFAA